MKPFQPWKNFSPLTQDRLSIVATLLYNTRDQTNKMHDAGGGDDALVLGLRSYRRSCHALQLATLKYEWLTIVKEQDKPLRFIFAIDSVPIRFFHGDANDPPAHYLLTSPAESAQQNLALEFVGVSFEHDMLRMAIQTDSNNVTTAITLVRMDQFGTALEGYNIPYDIEAAVIAEPNKTTSIQLTPINVEPPQIGFKKIEAPGKDQKKAADENLG